MERKFKTLAALCVVTLASGLAQAGTVILTFDGLQDWTRNRYVESGYQFTTDGVFRNCARYIEIAPLCQNGSIAVPAGPREENKVTMSRVDGGLFDLTSFDASFWGGNDAVSYVDAYRYVDATGSHTVTFAVQAGGLRTFTPNLTGLSSFVMHFYDVNGNQGSRFDNVVLSDAAAAPTPNADVPEPQSLALVLTALGAAGAAARRRRSSVARRWSLPSTLSTPRRLANSAHGT